MKTSARCAAALILSCLALTALSGCYTTRVTRAKTGTTRPPTKCEDIRVYRAEASAPPHEILGEISLNGEAGLVTDRFQEAVFCKKAAELGANGIILLYGRQLGGAALLLSRILPVVPRGSRALAVYVKEPQ